MQQKASDIPRLPLLFYIVTPSTRSGLRVHLVCPDFSRETGFTIHSLHDASREPGADNSDANIKSIVAELRDTWQKHIQPALDDMFPDAENTVSDNANIFAAALRSCIERVIARAETKRSGAYNGDIFDDNEYWDALSPIGIKKCKFSHEIPNLLYEYGIPMKYYKGNNEHKTHYIELSSL